MDSNHIVLINDLARYFVDDKEVEFKDWNTLKRLRHYFYSLEAAA